MYRCRPSFQSLVDNLLCAIANALIGGAPLAGLANLRNNLLRALTLG